MSCRAVELLWGSNDFKCNTRGIKRGGIVDVLAPIPSSSPEQGRNADVAMDPPPLPFGVATIDDIF